jgi:glyoxylase-like metal-dependent hydrolase (beta-lactamase superfamily II)
LRVIAVHRDVIVAVSRVWQTTCTIVRSGEEGFVIDSPVYPDELEALPSLLAQAGFPVSGLLATHGDWVHLLGGLAFPQLSLGCGEATAARLAASPGEAQRALRRFDDGHYVEGRSPLALAGAQSLPVPGRLELGTAELELHQADGHTSDGTAFLITTADVLVCGDYLSPVEIPMVRAVDRYAATLERLRPLVERAETVVPGHGAPLSRFEALRVLDDDAAYVAALAVDRAEAPLPRGRRSATQQRIHAENVARLEPPTPRP